MNSVYKHIFYCLFLSLLHPVFSQNVVYVYGDVSAKGVVPSGDAEPFHQMRLNDTGRYGMSAFKSAIEETGLSMREVYDADTKFNKKFLKEVDVLILASNQKKFSKREIRSIHKWIQKGGGLIAWSDSAFGGFYKHVGLDNTLGRDSNNLITEALGMYFLTDNGAGNYLINNYTKAHFINNNKPYGGIRFRGEGVSFVRVTKPAIVLAQAQEGGLGGKLKVNAIDGFFNPKTDAALAIATLKEGRVLGLFDRNMMWNAGDGTQITHSDNREFAQRILLWTAGIEDSNRIPKKTTVTKKINTPPSVFLEKTMSEDETTVRFIAHVLDNDNDAIFPEITWSLKDGPTKSVVFENNNPNTKTPVVTLPNKGTYTFSVLIKDGEFKFRKDITVFRNH